MEEIFDLLELLSQGIGSDHVDEHIARVREKVLAQTKQERENIATCFGDVQLALMSENMQELREKCAVLQANYIKFFIAPQEKP